MTALLTALATSPLPARLGGGPTGLSPDFEALRWFPLRPGCLGKGPEASTEDRSE